MQEVNDICVRESSWNVAWKIIRDTEKDWRQVLCHKALQVNLYDLSLPE